MRAVNSRLPWLWIERPSATLRRHCTGIAEMRVCSVGRHESLRLGGDGSEDALLLETLTVGATPVI